MQIFIQKSETVWPIQIRCKSLPAKGHLNSEDQLDCCCCCCCWSCAFLNFISYHHGGRRVCVCVWERFKAMLFQRGGELKKRGRGKTESRLPIRRSIEYGVQISIFPAQSDCAFGSQYSSCCCYFCQHCAPIFAAPPPLFLLFASQRNLLHCWAAHLFQLCALPSVVLFPSSSIQMAFPLWEPGSLQGLSGSHRSTGWQHLKKKGKKKKKHNALLKALEEMGALKQREKEDRQNCAVGQFPPGSKIKNRWRGGRRGEKGFI